jgi:hypothetical protein
LVSSLMMRLQLSKSLSEVVLVHTYLYASRHCWYDGIANCHFLLPLMYADIVYYYYLFLIDDIRTTYLVQFLS